jgi:transcription-repair coupling factor (superfamily II helicase)
VERIDYIAKADGRLTVSGAPAGYDAWLVAEAARRRGGPVLFVASDEAQADALAAAVAFFAPDIKQLPFPAWDCLPYDRVSPKPDVESARLATLAALAKGLEGPAVIVTSVAGLLQRMPPRAAIAEASFAARVGEDVARDALVAFLAGNGYARAGTVRDPGDFALRGGIVDLWPPGTDEPLRLDFFGETLDAIRAFDPASQLSNDSVDRITLLPASEAPLTDAAISRFRAGYVAAFGPSGDDPLYESVSAGRKAQGMEHWLPLFYDGLDTLFDYLPRCLVMLGYQVEEAKAARLELVGECYDTRRQFRDADSEHKVKAPPYRSRTRCI